MAVGMNTVDARSALTFRLSLPGLPSLVVGLQRMQTDIGDWSLFWTQRFAPAFYANMRQDVTLEGGGSGARWAPLSPAYATWKAARFPGAGILVRSGALKASLAGPDSPLSVFRPGPTSLEIGTSVPYAMYHQLGTSRMPQRPPLRVNGAFMSTIGKELQAHVQDAWTLRRAAFIADVKGGLEERL